MQAGPFIVSRLFTSPDDDAAASDTVQSPGSSDSDNITASSNGAWISWPDVLIFCAMLQHSHKCLYLCQLQAASCSGADGEVASGATTAVATTHPTMAAALQLRLHLLPHLAMILLRLLQLQLPLDMVCAVK